MSTAPQTNSERLNLTSEIAVDLLNPPKKEKKFGILDIRADSICTPPQFTEETTISAMKNLGISPEDLVLISERPDELSSVSENSGMKMKMNDELEKKRLEAIEKIKDERSRIIMEEDIEISVPKTIDDSENEIDKTNKTQPPRKKKKSKSNLKTGNKKSKVKKKNTENNSNFDNETRRRKTTKSSIHRFQRQKSKLPAKAKSSLSTNVNNEKPSTNRRPPVAERRQKYSSRMTQNQTNSENLHTSGRKNNFIENEANRINDMMLINIKVKANEERCRMEREEKRQLIKKQAQLRMERLKGEETQFERMKRDRKTKAEEEMKRKERLYMKIQEKKMKALEQERKKRQQKIYNNNNKVKQEENNENEDRLSKLRQKIIDAQNNNPNFNNDYSQKKDDDDDSDLFSVTRPKNPKILTVKSNDLSDSLTNNSENLMKASTKSGVNNNNSISTKKNTNNPSEYSNDLPKQKANSKPVTNAKPILSATLNPQPVKNPLPRQNPKARSSLQSMNSGYYKQLLKLPVVGKNKTRIPCLRK